MRTPLSVISLLILSAVSASAAHAACDPNVARELVAKRILSEINQSHANQTRQQFNIDEKEESKKIKELGPKEEGFTDEKIVFAKVYLKNSFDERVDVYSTVLRRNNGEYGLGLVYMRAGTCEDLKLQLLDAEAAWALD